MGVGGPPRVKKKCCVLKYRKRESENGKIVKLKN